MVIVSRGRYSAAITCAAVLTACSVQAVTFPLADDAASDASVADVALGDPPMTATYDLVVARAGSGSVSSNPAGIDCGVDCVGTFVAGTMVTLSAEPAAGSAFEGWSGDCGGTRTCTVTMDRASSVTASFGPAAFVLTVATAGAGHGSVRSMPAGIDCGADCVATFDAGTSVTLTATEAAGSVFARWQGACAGSGPCELRLTRPESLTAMFSPPGGLYMINESTGQLERLDPVTLVGTSIGPLGVAFRLGDCAWSPADATLYMVDGQAGQGLYRVDLTTGAASLIVMHEIPSLLALAYHPTNHLLYGIATGSGSHLYEINAMTGQTRQIGPTGLQQVEGLAWDSRREMMLALSDIPRKFSSIDLSSGVAMELQPTLAIVTNFGMTYDPSIDQLWVADTSSRILRFDPSNNFAPTSLVLFSSGHTCIAFVPPP